MLKKIERDIEKVTLQTKTRSTSIVCKYSVV